MCGAVVAGEDMDCLAMHIVGWHEVVDCIYVFQVRQRDRGGAPGGKDRVVAQTHDTDETRVFAV